MANNKYRLREFTPNANQVGMTHSIYVEAVIDNIITNKELARKIEARGLSRASEIKGILEELTNVILEEVKENNRVQLEGGDGVLVSIYPTASGSISDKDVAANPAKYPGKTRAEESMLTPDMVKWSLGARIGSNIARQFALQKTAQRVAYSPAQQPADPSGQADTGNGGTSGSGNGSTDNTSGTGEGTNLEP